MLHNDAHFLTQALLRLLLAAVLGAVVGLERELKRKPAGLRTIILITFASAFFTILSEGLAAARGGDPYRIASNLIPGIGFLGAGSIIRSRTAIVGLTTAATIFAMASVGMAAGGGFFLLAVASTLLLLLFLVVLGWIEQRTVAKIETVSYSFSTRQAERCISELEQFAHEADIMLRDLRVRRADNECTVEFDAECPAARQAEILRRIDQLR